MKLRVVLLAAALCLAALGSARAEMPNPLVTMAPVHSQKAYARPGSYPIAFKVDIAGGFHINSDKPDLPELIATQLSFQTPPGLYIDQVSFPKASKKKLEFLGEEAKLFEGSILIRARLNLSKEAVPGPVKLTAVLFYQGCDDKMCLMPQELALEIPLEVSPEGTASEKLNPEVFK